MQILNKEQVERKFNADTDAVLINVTSRTDFERQHIPGSINIPFDAPDFIRQLEKKVDDPNADVIVYCAGYECPKSTQAAEKLKKVGYKRVYDFKGGLEEWRAEGGDLKSFSRVRRVGDSGETSWL